MQQIGKGLLGRVVKPSVGLPFPWTAQLVFTGDACGGWRLGCWHEWGKEDWGRRSLRFTGDGFRGKGACSRFPATELEMRPSGEMDLEVQKRHGCAVRQT